MKHNTLLILTISLLLVSCSQPKSGEVERLKAENDSLQSAKLQLEEEVNGYFATLNDIQQNKGCSKRHFCTSAERKHTPRCKKQGI